MLETIREFGRERLVAETELEATADAHALHFASLAEEAETHLTAGRDWLDRIEGDHANVRAALSWLAERDLERALWMGGRLWRFWHLRGHLREGSEILRALLARQPSHASSGRAKALVGLAGLVYWQTDFEAARRSYEEALGIARAVGEEVLEVEILYSLAYVRAIEADYEGANRELESAAVLYASQGNPVMATWVAATIGMNTTLSGDHEGSLPILEDAIRRFAELGEAYGERNASSVLSRALMNLGRVSEAAAVNSHVLGLALNQQDITSLSAGLHDAASIAVMSGRLETGARLIGAAERMVEETGAQPPPTLINRVAARPVLAERLSGEDLEQLIAEGRDLSPDEAVSLARSSSDER
jgi:tetratricopeptide (TPR) repeat protein